MKKYFKYLIVLLLLFSTFLYYKVIHLPFPFIEVYYVGYDEFYKSPDNQNRIVENISSDSLISRIKPIVKLSREIVSEGNGSKIRTKDNILGAGKEFKQICSETAKVLFHLFKKQNIPSRVVWMNGHTVTEVFSKATGWFLVDPYGDIIIKDCKGDLLNLIEIKGTECLDVIDLNQDSNLSLPNYLEIDYLNSPNNVFRDSDQNLFVVINSENLFDYHSDTKDLSKIFSFAFLFDNQIGSGKQLILEDSKKVGNVGLEHLF